MARPLKIASSELRNRNISIPHNVSKLILAVAKAKARKLARRIPDCDQRLTQINIESDTITAVLTSSAFNPHSSEAMIVSYVSKTAESKFISIQKAWYRQIENHKTLNKYTHIKS